LAVLDRRLTPLKYMQKAVMGSPAVLACARTFRNWSALLRIYMGAAEFEAPFMAVGRKGFTIQHWEPADVQTTWAVFCARTYDVPVGAETVLDLGANIGTFSIYATRYGAKRVIALEPVEQTFHRLQQNIAANSLEQRVEVLRRGIGGTAGPREIHLGVSSPHSSMFFRNNPQFESGQTETIEVMTLERLFEDYGLDEVEMCKMDCEGGEVEAILAASDETLRRMRRISMEYHFPGDLSNKEQFFGRLEAAGFRCVWHSKEGRMAQFVRQ
jgi:FkbM family methyltransferase